MPKHIEGVFGRAFCPKDATAQDRHSTLRWPTAAVLLCPLRIIEEFSSTTVEKRNAILRVLVPHVKKFFFDAVCQSSKHNGYG
jgi:hypothetical protein